LRACRRADTLAVLQEAGRDGWGRLAERIGQSKELFGPVAEDEFYLSKLWVARGSRRAGHGVRILREYLRTGVDAGFRRFRLDVWAQNRPAIELYLGSGFAVLRESSSDRAGMTYLSLGLERRQDDDVGADPSRAGS
jgi:ribosomal protein S18 acetylase RimI-like enzyme